MQEFENDGPTLPFSKHNNACGLATRPTLQEAYEAALAADPVARVGGVRYCQQRNRFSYSNAR